MERVRSGPRFTVTPSARWIAIVLGLALGTATAIAPLSGLALAIAGIVIGLFAWNPVAGLAALIMSRSSLDWFQDATREQTALLFNPASALGILMVLLAAVLIAVRVRNRQPVDWGGRPGLAWGGWVAFSGLGVLVALLQFGGAGLGAAFREWVRLASIFAVYLLVVNLARDRRSRQIVIAAILLGVAIPALVGIGQIFSGESIHEIDGVRRIHGTFVHPGGYGLYLAAIAMISLGLWRDAWGGKGARPWIGLSFVTTVILMVLTYTRAALGIFLCAIVIWGWRGSRRQRFAVLGSVFAVALALAPFIAWRFQDLMESGDPSAGRTNSFLWRLFNFRNLLGRFTESPIVGFGLKQTAFVNPTRTSSTEGYERGFAPHSELIRVLVEQGIVGLIAYVVMVFLLLSSIQRLSSGGSGERPAELAGLGRALYAYLAACFILAPFGADLLAATTLFYVFFATIAVLYTSGTSTVEARSVD